MTSLLKEYKNGMTILGSGEILSELILYAWKTRGELERDPISSNLWGKEVTCTLLIYLQEDGTISSNAHQWFCNTTKRQRQGRGKCSSFKWTAFTTQFCRLDDGLKWFYTTSHAHTHFHTALLVCVHPYTITHNHGQREVLCLSQRHFNMFYKSRTDFPAGRGLVHLLNHIHVSFWGVKSGHVFSRQYVQHRAEKLTTHEGLVVLYCYSFHTANKCFLIQYIIYLTLNACICIKTV